MMTKSKLKQIKEWGEKNENKCNIIKQTKYSSEQVSEIPQ